MTATNETAMILGVEVCLSTNCTNTQSLFASLAYVGHLQVFAGGTSTGTDETCATAIDVKQIS